MQKSIRNVVAYCFAVLVLTFGFVRRARKRVFRDKLILSILFHDPSKHLFLSSIKWLQRNGFYFISLQEFQQFALGKISLPEGAVLLTVDDGWRNNLNNIVDVADNLHIPVTIFVSTEPIEHGGGYWWSYVSKAKKLGISQWAVEALKKQNNSYRLKILSIIRACIFLEREAMTKDELISISASKYITIGSHSVTHPILPQCTEEVALYEISESKKKLEQWLRKRVTSFSYPNGDYSKREIELIKEFNFEFAFTTSPGYVTKNSLNEMFEIPRFEMLESASFIENICRMTGVWFINKHPN